MLTAVCLDQCCFKENLSNMQTQALSAPITAVPKTLANRYFSG